MTTKDDAVLNKLIGSVVALQNATDDMRGRKAKDKDGKDFGKVHDVFVDDREREPRFLLIDHGGFLGFGEKKSFIPVDAIKATTSDDVFVNDSSAHIAEAPAYDPDRINERAYQSSIFDHYGCAPYWSAGYTYPGFNQ